MSASWKTAPAIGRTYSFRELVNATGVSFTRLRYWQHLGLISHPSPRVGRGASYTDNHVREIRAILDAKDANVTLLDLRDRRRARA